MEEKINSKKLAYMALSTALVFICTRFTAIPAPIPPGYINFGDTVIFLTAVLFGWKAGMLAGAIGSLAADLSFAAFLYAPITFFVKGAEGAVTGLIVKLSGKKTIGVIAGMACGGILMAAGYFLSEALLLGIIDKNFGFAAAVANLPPNLLQAGVSVLVGYILSIPLSRVIK